LQPFHYIRDTCTEEIQVSSTGKHSSTSLHEAFKVVTVDCLPHIHLTCIHFFLFLL